LAAVVLAGWDARFVGIVVVTIGNSASPGLKAWNRAAADQAIAGLAVVVGSRREERWTG
jgi:hypothetical protein